MEIRNELQLLKLGMQSGLGNFSKSSDYGGKTSLTL